MITYAILANPGHNRVYFEASKKLSLAELEIACRRFSNVCTNFSLAEIEGVFYVTFQTENPLSSDEIVWLSRLSFTYALFELRKNETEALLAPVQKAHSTYFNDDLNTILKYTGKTNEIFTRLMLNIAVLTSEFHGSTEISVLDPVAGKGTTLFEALIAGYNGYGVEINPKAVHEASVYFKKYLETVRYKHTFKKEKFSGEAKSHKAEFYRFEFARSKEDQKMNRFLQLCMVAGDAKYTNRFYKKNMFHVIVGDLPYGVHHSNVANKNQSSFTRNPKELLETCLPGWIVNLKPGGTIVLAWNKFVLKREQLEEVFAENGLFVLNEPPYNQFEHRVDQAINRDIIVAKKK